MKLISIEGNIGTGKSTLAKNLADALNYKLMKEPVEDNPYLEEFYKDPKALAFKMQFWLLHNRFRAHKEAVEHIWHTNQGVVQDRSIYGDQVFAKQHYLTGNMSLLDYETYLAHRELTNNQLLPPTIAIFLESHPEICIQRIKSRGRDCEKEIPIDYLIGLQERHKELILDLKSRGTKVYQIDWNNFKSTEEVLQIIGLA